VRFTCIIVGMYYKPSNLNPLEPLDPYSEYYCLLATGIFIRICKILGSADSHVYLYDIHPDKVLDPDFCSHKGELLQRLDGHSDRVYAACFHPKEPILASCSADFSVKIWQAKKS
jgi:WD40 repeat protein